MARKCAILVIWMFGVRKIAIMTNSFIYDSTDIDRRYDEARELPKETYALWADTLLKHLPRERIKTICDIGCGTGRFTTLLAEEFSAEIFGIDPSEKMLSQAKKNISLPAIRFHKGNAEAIPLPDNIADMLFLSMTYHHIQDKMKAISEFKRTLLRHGNVVIRTSTRQSLKSYPWLQFFPGAFDIELDRAPDRNGLITFFKDNGFTLGKHAKVNQLFAHNHQQYFKKISTRGLSSLKAISDIKFQSGVKRLEEYCRKQNNDQPIYEEIDFYVFSRI